MWLEIWNIYPIGLGFCYVSYVMLCYVFLYIMSNEYLNVN
jgi:hypothetical protein